MTKEIIPERIKKLATEAEAKKASEKKKLPRSLKTIPKSSTPLSKDIAVHTSLFACSKKRAGLISHKLPALSTSRAEVTATGYQPGQVDKDVWIACHKIYSEAQVEIGAPVFTPISHLAGILGMDGGGKDFESLRERLQVLNRFLLDISYTAAGIRKTIYGVPLLRFSIIETIDNEIVVSGSPLTESVALPPEVKEKITEMISLEQAASRGGGLICLTIPQELSVFFDDGYWYLEDLGIRRSLGKSNLAKFYYSEFLVHTPAYLEKQPAPLETYWRRSGHNAKNLSEFRTASRKALELLKEIGFLEEYEFVKSPKYTIPELLRVKVSKSVVGNTSDGQLELFPDKQRSALTEKQKYINDVYLANVGGIDVAVANIVAMQSERRKLFDALSEHIEKNPERTIEEIKEGGDILNFEVNKLLPGTKEEGV